MAKGSTVHSGPMPNVHCVLMPKKMRSIIGIIHGFIELIDWASWISWTGWISYGAVRRGCGGCCQCSCPWKLLTCELRISGSLYKGLCKQKLNGKKLYLHPFGIWLDILSLNSLKNWMSAFWSKFSHAWSI